MRKSFKRRRQQRRTGFDVIEIPQKYELNAHNQRLTRKGGERPRGRPGYRAHSLLATPILQPRQCNGGAIEMEWIAFALDTPFRSGSTLVLSPHSAQ